MLELLLPSSVWTEFDMNSLLPSPLWWYVLYKAGVLRCVLGKDLQGQVLVQLTLFGFQALQGLQLDEGLRACAEGPVGWGANGKQRVDLHWRYDVLILAEVKGF